VAVPRYATISAPFSHFAAELSTLHEKHGHRHIWCAWP
jgi:hypothetical protein